MAKLLAMVDGGQVRAVIVAKLGRLTRSVKDLCEMLERFERRGVALVSVAESLDTGSAAGRLVLNILAAVVGENPAAAQPTHDLARHRRCPQPTGLPNASGYSLAAGVRGASPQTGAGVIKRLMCS
jgi:hypothetical protein